MGNLFGGGTQTTKTKVDLAPEQKQLIGMAMPWLQQFSAAPPQLGTQNNVAPFNATQTQAQNMALAAAGGQAGLGQSGANATDFLLNRALFPQSNPALQGTIEAAIDPLRSEFRNTVLPGIGADATATGGQTGYSSTRKDIAEGLAGQGYLRSVANATSGIANNAYNSGLDAMVKGLGLVPQTQGTLTAPAATTSAVGDTQQALAQAMLTDQNQNQLLQAYAPLMYAKELLGASGAIPSAGTTSTVPAASTNPLSGALGGASLAASLFPGSMPIAAGGAGIGALLALL